jgi:hypothetical protein
VHFRSSVEHKASDAGTKGGPVRDLGPVWPVDHGGGVGRVPIKEPTMRLLMVLLLTTGSIFVAPQATGETPDCVTRTEFSRVHNGMTRARVHRTFATSGHLVSVHVVAGQRHESRDYRACRHPRRSMVSVQYGNGRVISKVAIWG